MGWMSTYQQTVSAEHGISGKTLRDALLDDDVIIRVHDFDKDEDKLIIDPDENEISGRCWDEFINGTCFSDDGNSVALTFDTDNENFLEGQVDALCTLSRRYPEAIFHLHSSYCPGGGGIRTTAIDTYVQNGRDMDSRYLLSITFYADKDDPDIVDGGLYVLTTPVQVFQEEIKSTFEKANELCNFVPEEPEPTDFPVSYKDEADLDTLLEAVELMTGWSFELVEVGKPVQSTVAYYAITQQR